MKIDQPEIKSILIDDPKEIVALKIALSTAAYFESLFLSCMGPYFLRKRIEDYTEVLEKMCLELLSLTELEELNVIYEEQKKKYQAKGVF